MKERILRFGKATCAALFVLLLSVVGMKNAHAQNFTVGNLNYSVNEDGVSVTVTSHVDGQEATGELVIPESVTYESSSYAVTSIGNGAFSNCSQLTGDLVIPNSVRTIWYQAFSGCSGFTSLTIGTGVEMIAYEENQLYPEYGAFLNCTGINTLYYNAVNCSQIATLYAYEDGSERSGFSDLTSLTTVVIGEQVQRIPNNAFLKCTGLTGTLTIPESVTSIGVRAFANTGFTTLNFNAVNSTMGGSYYWGGWEVAVFENCPLTTLNIGNNVQTIPYGAFDGLSSLSGTLVIPNSVTTIGEYAFANTGFTGTLTLSNSLTSIGDGVFMNCSFVGDLVIPNSVTSIGKEAFANCTGFTSLTIGTSVEVIGNPNNWYHNLSQNPFYNCSGITTLNFNAIDCYYIPIEWFNDNGHSPFAYLSSLTTLNIGESVQKLPPFAFDGCTGLTGSLSIPSSVIEIRPEAFRNCSGLTGTISIPESVTSIGGGAFDGCTGLGGSLTIGPNVTSIGPRAFAYTGVEAVNFNATSCEDTGDYYYIPPKPNYYNTIYREGYTFEGCENLATLNIGNGVERIPSFAFSYCTHLSGELNIPNTVAYIGDWAFSNCNSFAGSLVIPNSVNTIGYGAFSNCSGLTGSVTLCEGLQSVRGNAFKNTNLTSMNYNAINCFVGDVWTDEYETYYEAQSFVLPSSLTSLNFGDNVQSISRIAFKDCSILTGTLTFPNSLTSIGDQAFYNCSGLEGIVMGNSVETIGSEAFRNCGGIRGELTLPTTLLSVGNHAFASCDEITTINYNATNCTQMGDAQHPSFFDCASLAHINIGENVLSIPNYAFKRCSTVEDMTVAVAVPPTIGASTFATVSRSIPVIVPFGSGDDYRNAAYWQEFFNITEGYGPTPNSNHWQPNPHQSAFNMTVIGIIQIGGVEQTVGTLEIGAFCNDECRGSQILTYYPPIDRYLLFFTLYGEQGDQLTFRLYDHATSQESLLVCTEVMTFVPDNIVGSYQDPHVFNFVSIQNSILSQGWNWHSSYVELGTGSLDMMTSSLGESGLMIKSQSNGFTAYDAGEWFGTLTAVNNANTYLINTGADCVMSVAGSFVTPDQHPITLSNGWNWIGYPSTNALDLNTALGGLAAQDGDMIKNQDNFSVYIAGMGWVGNFNTIYPGMGLMYNSNAMGNTTFAYVDGERSQNENTTSADNHWVVNRQAYPYNMSVMAVVSLDGTEHGGDVELAAFVGDECRGSARLLYVEHLDRHIAFLTVTGEESATLTMKLYDPATGMEYETTASNLSFEANGIEGSLDNPFIVDFSTTTETDEPFANGLAAYPNPVNANGLVRINMPYESEARVEIVNALGAMVSAENVTGSSSAIKAPATKGVYVMKVAIDGKGIYTCKLIVE